ncbi:MAG: aspartyl protease family protein [Planctomycetota bacterium]|jgi:predicted aspartyl protease
MKKKVDYFFFLLFMPVLFSCGCKSSKSMTWSHVKPLANKQNRMQISPKVTHIPDTGSQHEVTLRGNIPFVEVHINRQGPFLFAVDTGVTGLMISNQLARRLGLEISSKDTEIILNTPSGKTNLGRPLEVERVNIGSAVFLEVEAARIPAGALEKLSIEGIEFYGILGIELFGDCVVELDYIERRLTLAAPEDYSETRPEDVVPAVFTDGGIIIEGTIDNTVLPFMLDTGSPYGVSLSRKHKVGLKFKNGRKTRVLATLNGRQEVTISTLDGEAAFGHLLLKDPLIYIYTRNLLGGEVLKNYVLKIDQKQEYVNIRKK